MIHFRDPSVVLISSVLQDSSIDNVLIGLNVPGKQCYVIVKDLGGMLYQE